MTNTNKNAKTSAALLHEYMKEIREDFLRLMENPCDEGLAERYDPTTFDSDYLDIKCWQSTDKKDFFAELWITVGGPNVWLDTRHCGLFGVWGDAKAFLPIPDSVCHEINAVLMDIEGIY